MALTKVELAQALVTELGFSRRDAKHFVDSIFHEAILDLLAEGEIIKISGFGNFTLRDKEARPGRNPKTGKDVPISARRVVTFRPGQKLKKRVEAYVGLPEGE